MTRPVFLLDLGNTLVHYYNLRDFGPILEECIESVGDYLTKEGGPLVEESLIAQRVKDERYESSNHRVRPLQHRLFRIFAPGALPYDEANLEAMCSHFMAPIFSRAQLYPDTLPFLQELRSMGFRASIVSNTPWGSPGKLWRRELKRHGLDRWVDHAVFCTDVGWRKPARPIFHRALNLLGAEPDTCLFVGDDPRWDRVGPESVGMPCHIIARMGKEDEGPLLELLEEVIRSQR